MKTLLMKWNFLVILFIMCSVPLLVGCGDDDDDVDPDDVTTTVIGWKDDGNKATFGYKQSYGGFSWSGIVTLTFNGSGDDAVCTKCVVEETFPNETIAEQVAAEYSQENYKNMKRSGKKITYDEDEFIGDKRGDLRKIISSWFG